MTRRPLLAAIACAAVLASGTALPTARATPPDHVQQAKAERKAAKEHRRICATQDLSGAFVDAYPYATPVPVRCTDGFPAELELTKANQTGWQGFEVVNVIDHDGPLFMYFGDRPLYWTYGPEYHWWDGDTGSLPSELLDRRLRLAYYDVHGDLVAWQWMTIQGYN